LRSKEFQSVADALRRQVMGGLTGRRRVLVETPDTGRTSDTWVQGLSEDYFPVRFRSPAPWNTFQTVVLKGVVRDGDDWVLEADLAEPLG
jgi:hypothetical protein